MFSSRKSNGVRGGNPTLGTKSLRFRSSASAYLSRTPSSTGSTQKLTYSTWVKRGILSAYSNFGLCAAVSGSSRDAIRFTNTNQIDIYFAEGGTYDLSTTAVFVDPSAWYHVVVAIDTTQATASNRVILYVNNVQITLTGTQPAQNYNFTGFNVSGKEQDIGRNTAGAFYYDGEIADTYLIDGQQLTPSSFASTNATTGQWSPAQYTGTFGTNGFYLPFNNTTSTTTLGYDQSGNANNWTTNNISLTAGSTYDSMNDVPVAYSATAANYAVLNPLDATTVATLTNGNLTLTQSSVSVGAVRATVGMTGGSGKYYWEVLNSGGNNSPGIGTSSMTLTGYVGTDANGWSYFIDGSKYFNGTSSAYGATYTTGDLIGVAYDTTTGTLTFYKNGTSQGVAFTGLTGTMFPALSTSGSSSVTANINFGQRPFTYTPPSGYNALNTYNLPTPTIAQGKNYFNSVLYTGNGSTNTITGVGFQPDFVWAKDRGTANSHRLVDAVRGVTKSLYSNLTDAEGTESGLTAFNSDGFTLGSATGMNYNTEPFVAWNWKANGAGSSNTNGSITSTVSANTTSGFSVVTYTGTGTAGTIGHGLGVAPSMIIVKSRSATGDWPVYHSSLGNGSYALLDTYAASAASSSIWNATSPTSSVFSVGINTVSNTVTVTYVAYCFTPIAGFSAFGSYTGNGSATGPFIYTGFRPKFLMIKRTDSISDWSMLDSSRNTYNSLGEFINADTAGAGNTYTALNFLSNGFNSVWSDTSTNASGGTYIYMAFASNPFAYSNAF